MFPPNGSLTRHPLPSTGFPRIEFPGFNGTMECSDARSPLRPHFVSFAWPYHPLRLCSLLTARRRPEARDFRSGNPPIQSGEMETTGPPRFPGDPLCLCLVLRPRRNRPPPAVTLVRHGSRRINDESDPRLSTFEAQWQASALAVDASQDGSLHHHARLASGSWPDLTGWDWLPTGSQQKVSEVYLLQLILLLQAFLAQ